MFCISSLLDSTPVTWAAPRVGYFTAWHGHIAFAHWLVAAAQPRTIVELGTHNGASYAAFCNSVKRSGLPTQCYAVDTWQGDEHAGGYGSSVYEHLKIFNDENFKEFSTLLRCTFDEALGKIADQSVDILHIDGLHTYEAVKHDFDTWRPKLSSRAVVLFHDTVERGRGFGVYTLWAELAKQFPSFEFHHSSGLGVLAVGVNAPAEVIALCRMPSADADKVRRLFQECSAAAHRRAIADMNAALSVDAGTNIALHCAASQSSHYETRTPTPQGAVNGFKVGGFGFHTQYESEPWWMVDLGVIQPFTEVRIYNRIDSDCIDRACSLEVLTSSDDEIWKVLYQHDGSLFGGIDGRPLRIHCPGTSARYVKIRLRVPNFFHLDEVEILQRA